MALWKHSFFAKLLAGNLLLIVLLVVVGGLVSYHEIDQTYIRMGLADQQRTVTLMADYMEHIWLEAHGRVDAIDPICKRLMVNSPMRLTVIAADGQVLGDSEADPNKMENHYDPNPSSPRYRPEVVAALKGEPGAGERPSETLKIPFRYLARPLTVNGKIVGVARVAMPVRNIVASESFIRKGLLIAGAAAGAGALLLALLLSWIWYAPLRQITRTAKALAGGDLSNRAAIAGSDELAQLATSLNEMRDSISGQITQIAAQKQNLLSVLDNLREGVIGLDDEGRILLANQAAIELLAREPIDNVLGRHLQTVVRAAEVIDAYTSAVSTARPSSRTIEWTRDGRRMTLDVHARKLQAGSAGKIGGIVVVRDVTEIARSAAMKAEFVANASHELRTPLATIRAAVDSLTFAGTEDPDAFTKCIDIINRHVSRLENMTNDLLDLNIAETGRTKLRGEDIPVGSIADWVRSHFAAKARDKDVDLAIETDDDERTFHADRRLLELIIQNLVENAIKFTPARGRVATTIIVDPDSGELTVRVSDTGCGISDKDKPRIFERFFQADPARSGDTSVRGTGLGLAIVKHACERLGARIAIDSELTKGTTVTITVPVRAGE